MERKQKFSSVSTCLTMKIAIILMPHLPFYAAKMMIFTLLYWLTFPDIQPVVTNHDERPVKIK